MQRKSVRIAVLALTAAALSAFFGSCGPKNGIIGDPVKGMTLQYSLDKGQSLTYKSSNKNIIDMEQMGQQINMVTGSDMLFTLTGTGNDAEGNITSDLRVDEFSMTMEGVPGMNPPDFSSTHGHVMEYIFTPAGQKVAVNDPDSLKLNLGMMGGGEQLLTDAIQGILAGLPKKQIKIGDTWTETSLDTTQRQGMDVATDTETTYTLAALETVQGYKCLKIISKAEGTLDGQGQAQGMDMTLEGDLETSTEIYFAYKEGILVKQHIDTFVESTIVISGPTNMTMPMVNESSMTIELVK